MNFWREKKNRIYIIVITVLTIFISQYFLFKYGIISPLVKGIELTISKGDYIQNIDEYVIKLGETIKVNSGKYIVIPPYASKPKIGFKASDPDVLSIDGDTIKGVKEGYSALMITKDGRAIRKTTVRVVKPKVENLDVEINQLKYVGDSSPINVNVDVDFNFKEKEKCTYEISNDNVLQIEGDTLKAIGVGTSKLYINAGDKVKEYTFNIQARVSDIYANDNINIRVNEEKNIDANVETVPKNLKHPKITYELLGFKMPIERAISLSTTDGTIKGIREGTEKVKIACGGKTKIVTVNVLKEDVESQKVENLEAKSKVVGDNLEITLTWDYLDDILDYEIYLKNNSLGDKDFNLFESIKVNKSDMGKDKKISTTISLSLKDMKNLSLDIYVVGNSNGKHTQRSNVVKVREEFGEPDKKPDNIADYQVENLQADINDENEINLSWDKLDKFDCTYSVYIKDNIKTPDGGYVLYQHGISKNNISIPMNKDEDIDVDIYVVANSSNGSSKNSKTVKISKIKLDNKTE